MTFRRAYGLSDIAEATAAAALADDWRHHGACADEDPDLFFPDGVTGQYLVQAEQAKAVCRGCPVMQQCGNWALDTRQDAGVWGGLDENERRLLLRRRGRGTGHTGRGGSKPTSPCGTPAAYRRHQRNNEEPCDACRNANTNARRRRTTPAKATV